MDIFTRIYEEIKSKGGEPLTFSATGTEEEIMNEKDKQLVEDIKTWEMPEKQEKETIAWIKRDRRQKEKFMKLSKEERLKRLCREHIDIAIDGALWLGAEIQCGSARKSGKLLSNRLRIEAKTSLTRELKAAKVLALEG
jgi:hypothetical protein